MQNRTNGIVLLCKQHEDARNDLPAISSLLCSSHHLFTTQSFDTVSHKSNKHSRQIRYTLIQWYVWDFIQRLTGVEWKML